MGFLKNIRSALEGFIVFTAISIAEDTGLENLYIPFVFMAPNEGRPDGNSELAAGRVFKFEDAAELYCNCCEGYFNLINTI